MVFRIFLLSLVFLSSVVFVEAQSYSTLINAPELFEQGEDGVVALLNGIYTVVIVLAAILAVMKIILGGVKFMVSDVVPTRADAKKDIQNALLGLLIILSTYLILFIINPNLVNLNIFSNINEIRIPETSSGGQTNTNDPASTNDAANAAADAAASGVNGGCRTESTNDSDPEYEVIVIDYSGCDDPDIFVQASSLFSALRSRCKKENGLYTSDSGTQQERCSIPTNSSNVLDNAIASRIQTAGTREESSGGSCRSSNEFASHNFEDNTCYWPAVLMYGDDIEEEVAREDCFGRADAWFWESWPSNDRCVICPGTFENISGPVRGYECSPT